MKKALPILILMLLTVMGLTLAQDDGTNNDTSVESTSESCEDPSNLEAVMEIINDEEVEIL